MTEQLESLLKKIQNEAVSKAETRADEILAAAEKKADAILRDAEEKAQQKIAAAEKEAERITDSGRKSLEQAARDLLIFVRQSVMRYFEALMNRAIPEMMPISVLQEMLVKVAVAAVEKGGAGDECIDVFVSKEDARNLIDFFVDRFRKDLGPETELHPVPGIKAGFKISLSENNIVYDFSDRAIIDMLGTLVNPMLSDILNKALEDNPKHQA